MTDTACCAHLHVKYVTADFPGGGTRGWWECEDCKHPFAPVPRQTDTPTPQPDLSDEALSQLAEAIFEMDIVDAVKAVRSVRDQAQVGYDQVKNLLDSRETKLLMRWGELFPNYTWTDGEMAIDYMAAEIIACRKERDQARAAERKRTLLWVADEIDSALSGALKSLTAKMVQHREAAEEGGKDA